jgi:hypothetical protein
LDFERGPSRKKFELVQGFSRFASLKCVSLEYKNKGSDAGFPHNRKSLEIGLSRGDVRQGGKRE